MKINSIEDQIISVVVIREVTKSTLKSNGSNSMKLVVLPFDSLRTLIAIYYGYAYFLHEEKRAQEMLRPITTK